MIYLVYKENDWNDQEELPKSIDIKDIRFATENIDEAESYKRLCDETYQNCMLTYKDVKEEYDKLKLLGEDNPQFIQIQKTLEGIVKATSVVSGIRILEVKKY